MKRFTRQKGKQKLQNNDPKTLVVSKGEFLKLRPIINPNVYQKKKTDGDLLLELDIRELKRKSLLRRMFPSPDTKKILLDKLGMEVFLLCDGEHKVKDIIKIFQEKYRLTPTETELSVQKYLMSLTERHLVGFLIPEKITAKMKITTKETIDKVILDTD
ncbi:MAG: PqqD family protein [Candidatus Heimdallarchaeota archaeon]|nr:MAG: PqqD family protein [Candidatus Heimdallarchaeota archaeon]